MGKRLYVGNLPYTTTEDELRTLFGECGSVSDVSVVADRDTGRSKGFGFVEMGSDDEARTAIDRMNGTTMGERQIRVDEARPPQKRNGGGGGRF